MRGRSPLSQIKLAPTGTAPQMKVLGFTDDFAQVIGPDGKLGFMMAWGWIPSPMG